MLTKLTFSPGINRENTNYTNEGGWHSMDKVRFRSGSPQKIGGWVANSSGTYQGVARSLINWASNAGENLIGVGTHVRYFISYGQSFYNITPERVVPAGATTLTDPFTTTSGSTLVLVAGDLSSATIGDYVIFSGATTVGGIPAAEFNSTTGLIVQEVIDADHYVVELPTAATSSATGGGTVTVLYEIHAGLPTYSVGNGWNAGVWNGPTTTTATTLTLTAPAVMPMLLDSTSTTIDVTSTTGFTATGTVLIETEQITYTGVTGTSFTGCTRGAGDTIAAAHAGAMTSPGVYADVAVRQVTALAGDTGWGLASSTGYGVGQQLRLWTNDNYGEDLIIAPRGGAIYYWSKDTSGFARAVPLRTTSPADREFVPHTTNQVIVADAARIVMAIGANPYDPLDAATAFDPMLVRWSAQEDPYDWVPRPTNQAGELRMSVGSYAVTALEAKQEMLVWTDAGLYSWQYLGAPSVWGATLVMGNLSIMGPNVVAAANNTVFWMGLDKFYAYNGRVETLPCSIRQFVFNDIALQQSYQTCAGTNEGYNEVWWHYVSKDELVLAVSEGRDPSNDRYVIYNHLENIWYYGTLRRTAWIDSPLQSGPLAAYGDTTSGLLITHEQGNDDAITASIQPIYAYIQSADFDIEDGNRFMFVWRMLPDVSFEGSDVDQPEVLVSLYPRQNPGAAYGSHDQMALSTPQNYSGYVRTYTIQQFTQVLYTRLRGRQMSFRIESSGIGVQWQLGTFRLDARVDGRKS